MASTYTDTQLLDWLAKNGDGAALINDDNGHWTVCFAGVQNVPRGDEPQDIDTRFFIEKDQWYPTIREAIVAAIEEFGDGE